MDWLWLTLLAITARATYSIATKILSKDVKVSPVTHSLLLTSFAGLLSIFISPFVGGISFSGIESFYLSALVMILSQAFGNILFFKGLKDLDAGTTQVAFSSILIWGAVLSVVFLGTVFSPGQMLGMLIMLLAIVLVQHKKGKLDLSMGFIYIIASAMLFAVFQVASADLARVISTGAYLLMAYLGPSLVVGFIYMNRVIGDLGRLRQQLKESFAKTLFASGTSLLYFVFSYIAYKHAPDRGVVVVLLTAQVVLSVIFGIIFLKEKEGQVRKLLAGALAFLAGVMIKA